MIIEELSSGKITAGEKLNERQIAKEFHVSRTPVREAFAQLEKAGIIEVNSKLGAVVKKLTIEQFDEILEIISVLEGYAIEIAVSKGFKAKDLAYIKQLEKKMEVNVEEKDYFKYTTTNRKFHEFIFKKAGNSTLANILKELMRKVYIGGLTLPFHINEFPLEHSKIIEAISKRLPKKAGIMMRKHNQNIKKCKAETLKKIKKIPFCNKRESFHL